MGEQPTLLDLMKTNQKVGEDFPTYSNRYREMLSKLSIQIPEDRAAQMMAQSLADPLCLFLGAVGIYHYFVKSYTAEPYSLKGT